MIIKKYVGKTEEEATEIAKKELGNDVVVMNVKEVKPKGFFAFMRPKTVEVTVALEDERDKFSTLRKESVPKGTDNNAEKKAESYGRQGPARGFVGFVGQALVFDDMVSGEEK